MEVTALVQRAYTAVVEHFVKTGQAPHYTELAGILGLEPDEQGECSIRQPSPL